MKRMKQNINIEAEGSELVLKNKVGDYVIIPKKYRTEVQGMIEDGCHSCIDSLVETLPIMADYAEDGSLYSEYLTTDPPTKKTTQHSLDPNPDGSLPSYFKGSDANPIQLDEVTVTAEAPEWVKYRKEYVKNNPFNIDEYVESRYNAPVGREAIKKIDGDSWRKELRQEGLEKRYNSVMDYVGEQLVKNKQQGKLSRAEWLNQMSDKEEEIIKRNPKYQSSLWADTKRGLTSLVEQNPLQTFQNILTSSDYSNREKREMLKDYVDHPIMSKLGDAAKIFNPLTIPSKMVQSAYKDDYSFTDALKGKKNDAGIVEDIVTDPLNLVGAGLVGKLSKADKVIDAAKAVDKISDISKPTNILKFDDLKNENEFFRIIVGDEAFDDIIKTGQIRVQRPSSYKTEPGVINLDRRGTTPSPSFSKGKPSIEYAKGNPEHYIIRTSEPLKPSTMGAHGKGSTMFPTDEAGKHLKSLDASKTQVYKHIGNGEYELVDVTKAGSKMLNKTDDPIKLVERKQVFDEETLGRIERYNKYFGIDTPNSPLTMLDKIKIGRDVATQKNLDRAYRNTHIDEIINAKKQGYFNNNRFPDTDWYYGGSSSKYGNIEVEAIPDSKYFKLFEVDGKYAGIVTPNKNILHLKGSNVPFKGAIIRYKGEVLTDDILEEISKQYKKGDNLDELLYSIKNQTKNKK